MLNHPRLLLLVYVHPGRLQDPAVHHPQAGAHTDNPLKDAPMAGHSDASIMSGGDPTHSLGTDTSAAAMMQETPDPRGATDRASGGGSMRGVDSSSRESEGEPGAQPGEPVAGGTMSKEFVKDSVGDSEGSSMGNRVAPGEVREEDVKISELPKGVDITDIPAGQSDA